MPSRHKRKQVAVVIPFKKKSDETGADGIDTADKPSDLTAAEPTSKNWSNKLRSMRLPLAIALVLVVAAAVAMPLYIKYQNAKKIVTIGDTNITKDDVAAYAKIIDDYKKAHPEIMVGGQTKQVALDDLVLNAALKYEAKQANIKVTDKDITDQLRQTNINDETDAKLYLSALKASPYGKMTITRNENEAYKNKLGGTILARKDIFIMQVHYDTPYMLSVPVEQVPTLFKQSTDRLNQDFGPLLQQKASKDTIAAKADVNYSDNNYTDDQDYQIYQRQNVTSVQYLKGYLSDPKNWNDLPKNDFRGFKLPDLSYTNDKIDALKNVGDYTPVFTSRAGLQMIIRLEGKNNGKYSSWTDFLKQYKDKYVTGKKLAFFQHSLQAVLSTPNKALYGLTSIGLQHADAVYCPDHAITFLIYAWDPSHFQINNSTNVQRVNEYRSASTCNGSAGDSYAGSRNSSWGGFGEALGDNCWNPAPSWSVAQYVSGWTYSSMNTTVHNTGALQSSGWPFWGTGINSAGILDINFYFVPQNGNLIGQRIDPNGNSIITPTSYVSFDRSASGSCGQTGSGTATLDSSHGYSFWFSGPGGSSHCLSATGTISYNNQTYSLSGYYYTTNGSCGNPMSCGSFGSASPSNNVLTNLGITNGQNSTVWWVYSPPAPGDVRGYRVSTSGGTISSGLSHGNGDVSFDGGGNNNSSCPETNANTTSYCSPYAFTSRTAGSHTVSANSTITSGGITYNLVGYSMCTNITTCHSSYTSSGNSVSVTIPSGGYVDLYWHYAPQVTAPVCSSFTRDAAAVSYNGSTVIRWSVSNSPTSVNISASTGSSPGNVAASGSWSTPALTTATTYTLTASNSGGSLSPPCTVTVGVIPTCTLGASPTTVNYNSTTTLSWNISGSFSSANIDRSVGAVSGATGSRSSTAVTANGTVFTLTVGNSYGSNPCPSPPINLTAPTCGPAGPQSQDTDYEWSFTADNGNHSYTWNIPGTMQAGYPQYSSDPGYTNNKVKVKWSSINSSPVYSNSNGQQSNPCQVNVTLPPLKPYLRAYGGDVAAGSGFGGYPCTLANPSDRGEIWGYNNGSGAGTGSQFAAFALNAINQFSSANGAPSAPLPPNGLSFANTVNSPWGGNFGKTWCAADYWATSTSVQASYTTGGSTVANTSKTAIYVSGNAYINGDILYADGTWTKLSDVPSFYLVVRGGNIYINNTVQHLNGVYVALPNAGVGGTIYTCTLNGNGTMPDTNTLSPNCGTQLTINGVFIAHQVKFQRSKGDITGSSSGQLATDGNIAEVFIYGPELWITTPAAGNVPTSSPSYDSITGLPPIL